MKPERWKIKTFRVNAKKFLLTYSQVPQKLTPDSVILQLQQKTGVMDYDIELTTLITFVSFLLFIF